MTAGDSSVGDGHRRMPLLPCLQRLKQVRGDAIVVSCMGSACEWQALSDHPLDFHYVPSSMGQAPSLGLGLALAVPEARVIVLNGDGSMLMNLGSLVTIGARQPPNLALIVVDNGVYEVTGGQPHCGAAAVRADGQDVDFSALAKAAGFIHVHRFEDAASWDSHAAQVLAETGPTFIHWRVWPVRENFAPRSPGRGPDRAAAFRRTLGERFRRIRA